MAVMWVPELTICMRHIKLKPLLPDTLKGGKTTRLLVQKYSSPKQPQRMLDQVLIASICHLIAQSGILLSLGLAKQQPGPWDKSAQRGEEIMARSGLILKRIRLQTRMTMCNLAQESIYARNTPLNSVQTLPLCMTIRKISDPWSHVSRLRKQRALDPVSTSLRTCSQSSR